MTVACAGVCKAAGGGGGRGAEGRRSGTAGGRIGGSKGAAGHDNVTFEGGFVIFVCQVPWTPGKVPSTPAVLRCPSARWIAPFSAGVAPFSPNRTPICEWLRLLPKALRPLPMVCVLFPGISMGYAAPRPYRGSGAALRCMSAPHVGVTSTFFFCMHYSKLSFLLKMRFCLVYSTSCRPGSAFINRGGCRRKPPSDKAFRRGLHRLT